jgi:L-ascorbate metabolism protein UlaG (beta-lactamase superfamily)
MRVMTDPMLGPRGPDAFVLPMHPSTGQENAHFTRYTATPHTSFDGLRAILVSHTHNDHVDVKAKEVLPKNLPVVVPPSGAETMRAAGFTDVRVLDWGQSLTIDTGGTRLEIHAVAAHHAHDPDLDHKIGRVNGYVLAFSGNGGSYKTYWTGDAVLSEEMKTIASRFGTIDLLLPHLGGVGGDGGLGKRTMDSEEAITLTRWVNPLRVIPIHHTTFSHYREPIEALEQRAAEADLAAKYVFPVEGRTVPL